MLPPDPGQLSSEEVDGGELVTAPEVTAVPVEGAPLAADDMSPADVISGADDVPPLDGIPAADDIPPVDNVPAADDIPAAGIEPAEEDKPMGAAELADTGVLLAGGITGGAGVEPKLTDIPTGAETMFELTIPMVEVELGLVEGIGAMTEELDATFAAEELNTPAGAPLVALIGELRLYPGPLCMPRLDAKGI